MIKYTCAGGQRWTSLWADERVRVEQQTATWTVKRWTIRKRVYLFVCVSERRQISNAIDWSFDQKQEAND